MNKVVPIYRLISIFALFQCATTATPAAASCGTAFCMANTNWNVQRVWTEPGARFDLRYEYIDQDQPRSGSNKVGVGQIRQHHDEVRTINRNWLATFDYTFDNKWGVSATLPLLDRDHTHIHNHGGAQLYETWDFSKIGDVRVLGRRQWQGENREALRLDNYGATFGLKLPTGIQDVRNVQGAVAERTLQPGTGTTDILLGAYFTRILGSGSSWFANVLVQRALGSHDSFEPGSTTSFDLGYQRNLSDQLGAMLQLNLQYKAPDKGREAEPANSGGKFVSLNPGLSYGLSKSVQIFGFVQVPIYQYVNGVQLTSDWAVTAGISTRF